MTTALVIPERYGPLLDILEQHHENLGHSGPVRHCTRPECWDGLETIGRSYVTHEVCRYCNGTGIQEK